LPAVASSRIVPSAAAGSFWLSVFSDNGCSFQAL
jgi:hypothetical protein